MDNMTLHLTMAHQCEVCDASFPKPSQLMQHRRTENHWPKFTCPSCKKTFTRKNNLKQHMKKHEDENNHHCPECLRVFT
ncbi:ZN577-like protein [Mya arenaria]|uniref:ZN577-like protein n=1 Tax=Mya arenaria TaxID=6604 RepID=A0ABY7FLE0_MYAAR|nr:ZN577-like protein [Mya arenaria]